MRPGSRKRGGDAQQGHRHERNDKGRSERSSGAISRTAREFAAVQASGEALRARHYIGGEEAPRAAVVVLQSMPDGFFLYRYASDGAFVGDTWHPDVDSARGQATFEFEGALGPWTVVPEGVVDPVKHALDASTATDP